MNKNKCILLLSFFFFLYYIELSAGVNVNDCIKMLEAGKIDDVLNIVNELDRKGKNYIMALYFFYKGEYEKAISEIKKAEFIDENIMRLSLFLDKLKRTTDNFKQKEFDNFIVRYLPQDEVLLYYLETALEKMHEKICERFNFCPNSKIIIEIFPSKEEFAFASTLGEEAVNRSGAIAICKFNRIMITTPRVLPFGYRWLDTICHELIHYMVNLITENNSPLWLQEGIARYYETIWRKDTFGEISAGSQTQLKRAISEDKLISFKRMHPSLVFLNNQDEVSLAFVEVELAVDYINKKFPGKLNLLLEKLKNHSIEKSFLKVFGKDMEKLENEIFSYIKKLDLIEYKGAVAEKIEIQNKDEIDVFVGLEIRDYITLGDRFKRNNNLNSALIEYRKALQVEPYNPVVLAKYARVLDILGRREEAVEKLLLCVDKNSNYVSGYELLGEFLIKSGRYNDALKYITTALEINPFNPYTHINLSKIYLYTGNMELSKKESSLVNLLIKK